MLCVHLLTELGGQTRAQRLCFNVAHLFNHILQNVGEFRRPLLASQPFSVGDTQGADWLSEVTRVVTPQSHAVTAATPSVRTPIQSDQPSFPDVESY